MQENNDCKSLFNIDLRISQKAFDLNNKGEALSYHGYFYRDVECVDERHCVKTIYLHFKPRSINDYSQITGYTTGSPYRAVIWEDGERRYLEIPQGTHGHAIGLAINNLGEVAGAFQGDAYIWDVDGKIHIMDSPNCHPSWPEAINDSSQVVGLAHGLAHGEYGEAAFLYDHKTHETVNLNDLLSEDSEWKRLVRAWDINNKGQIVGFGDFVEDGETNTYAFLMNPKPEPNADINNDKVVNWKDFAEFAGQWLEER